MRSARVRRPARGAGPARRAILRWSWRLLRREWRQQILVVALLVAAATYTTAQVPDSAEFGAASHLIRFGAAEPEILRADVAAARQQLDVHEVIYHRQVPVPGLSRPADYRAQDPDGPLGGPRLALLSGRYPTTGEVAITDGMAGILQLEVGGSLALDVVARPVVGIVENPGSLADEFVLVPPADNEHADTVTILANSSDDQARAQRFDFLAKMISVSWANPGDLNSVASVQTLMHYFAVLTDIQRKVGRFHKQRELRKNGSGRVPGELQIRGELQSRVSSELPEQFRRAVRLITERHGIACPFGDHDWNAELLNANDSRIRFRIWCDAIEFDKTLEASCMEFRKAAEDSVL